MCSLADTEAKYYYDISYKDWIALLALPASILASLTGTTCLVYAYVRTSYSYIPSSCFSGVDDRECCVRAYVRSFCVTTAVVAAAAATAAAIRTWNTTFIPGRKKEDELRFERRGTTTRSVGYGTVNAKYGNSSHSRSFMLGCYIFRSTVFFSFQM